MFRLERVNNLKPLHKPTNVYKQEVLFEMDRLFTAVQKSFLDQYKTLREITICKCVCKKHSVKISVKTKEMQFVCVLKH